MGDNDNITRQAEEIEALISIYGDEWHTEDECSQAYSIRIQEGEREVVLYVTLPPGYPATAPPIYQLSAPSLSRLDKLQLSERLENVYIENIGESILYQWVEAVKEYLQERPNDHIQSVDDGHVENVSDDELNETLSQLTFQSSSESKEVSLPRITHGETIVDRKSIFQGHVAVISSVDQVKLVISALMANKKIAHATHNIHAYRVEKNGCLAQDCEDDGETAAGGRLLHLLQIMDVKNVLVVVSRWYGGIHLGPDRFRHINNAARQVLEQAGLGGKKK